MKDAPPSLLEPREKRSSPTFTEAGLNRLRASMQAQVESGRLPGLVAAVSRHGELHVEAFGTQDVEGTRPMQRDTIFRIASLTKPIAATAAMMLVEEGELELDDAVDPWLPELANRRVLSWLDGPLDDTVPAKRAITLRDLLTLRMGLGHLMDACPECSILKVLNEQRLLMGFPEPQLVPAPDEWMRRLGEVPLMRQPGEAWMYDLAFDVLGVLIARVSGMSFEAFLRKRIFEPLGMKDTAFHVQQEKLNRLPPAYAGDEESGGLRVFDPGNGESQWATAPAFESGRGGLVSTADDYHAFCQMLLHRGNHAGMQLLTPKSVALMTSDQLTPRQREGNEMFFGDHSSWGLGMGVVIKKTSESKSVGRFGWAGGLGTTACTDPANGLIGILFTQRLMDSPEPPAVFRDFEDGVYGAL
ncbi:CubicO group peptidase (beta-lactamase class C family) [Roseimicrobium gellanilyticum]|uniref:CubicO group peptidase (Beta-lactamase class C family) n=1 Tax=Roseimicrobium gellanilyticum TaxID=748857 RepID=A0A366H4C3_9BACT|nr:serine hydrolase domain-containing protein [Roseimicrobium gellanilyticum]RBP36144.1 CubicO group peptidase (beta-lactamase class C family) [Roseimicrobium gellanilyticum]